MKECPFCLSNGCLEGEILSQTPHCYLVRTGDLVLAASVMIIPVRHVATPFDLNSEEWLDTKALLDKARLLLEPDYPDGFSIGWNVYPVGGQEIMHAHLHIIGRFADEPLADTGIRHALKQESNRRPGR